MATDTLRVALPPENVYGHSHRVDWMREHIGSADRVLEVGCGTGYRVTYPLLATGCDVTGIDIDSESIEYGQRLLADAGMDSRALAVRHVADVAEQYDVAIMSELIEHLTDSERAAMLETLRQRVLRPGGRLLVTVPNGYGWFELESFVWNKTGLGTLLVRTRLAAAFSKVKAHVASAPVGGAFASTLSSSPHLQRFTLRRIRRALEDAGFEIVEAQGSTFLAGPFSNLAFTGFRTLMALNAALGRRFPSLAAGFYVAARSLPAHQA